MAPWLSLVERTFYRRCETDTMAKTRSWMKSWGPVFKSRRGQIYYI